MSALDDSWSVVARSRIVEGVRIPEVPKVAGRLDGSAAGDEGDDDVRGVAVEVLATPVVDADRAGVGVTGGDLHVPLRNAGVQGGHDEAGSQHVRVHWPEPGPFADRSHLPVSGATVEPAAVPAGEDGAVGPFANGEIDGARRARHERDGGGLVAFADDAQGAVPSGHAKVFDVGGARLRHTQPVEPSRGPGRREHGRRVPR